MTNILDITTKEVQQVMNEFAPKNSLDLLMKISQKYFKQYEGQIIDIHTKDGQREFRRLACYTIEELMEAQNCLKIRDWTKSEYPADEVHFYEEIADFLNFVFQIITVLGLDEDKLVDIIIKKYIVNQQRQESAY